ncbi:hypothetical protein NDU88_006884 [Pleurodeles waltl]|uniref:Uncharacterized protein n=1 Tax=Pleurodeles waltl TaxID=8319 RepID=A0AAV7MDI8_PLEWA|nr:hypothetical protein NDU88_006884 [Pleurodeles waltl]
MAVACVSNLEMIQMDALALHWLMKACLQMVRMGAPAQYRPVEASLEVLWTETPERHRPVVAFLEMVWKGAPARQWPVEACQKIEQIALDGGTCMALASGSSTGDTTGEAPAWHRPMETSLKIVRVGDRPSHVFQKSRALIENLLIKPIFPYPSR